MKIKSCLAIMSVLMLGVISCTRDNYPQIPVEIKTVKVQKFPHSLSFGRNEAQLFVSCFTDQRMVEVDLDQEAIKNNFPVLSGPGHLINDANHNQLYVMHNEENGFGVIQLDPAKVIRTAKTGRLNLSGGSSHPDKNELWICDGQTKILVFTRALALKKSITVGRYPQQVIFLPGAEKALVTLKGENALAVVDTDTYKLDKKISVGAYPSDVLVVGNKACVSNYASNDVSIVDLVTGKEIKRIAVYKRPNALALKNNTLWVACEKSYRVVAINVSQAEVIGSIKTGFYPGDLLARQDGSLIVASPRDGKIAIIRPQLDQK